MVYRKINYKVIGYIFLCMLVAFACKKEAKDPIGAKIYAVMAHNGQPISGIKWKVKEITSKGFSGEIETTDWEINGETDGAGIALIEFHPKKNTKYQYDLFFDYSTMSVPTGDYVIIPNLNFDRLVREYMTPENAYNIRILPKMDVQVHYKNVNCFDGNDDFRYKVANIDESIYHDFNSQPWSDPTVLEGCADYPNGGGTNWLAGHIVYVWEATRGGVITTGIDTFYVSPDGNNLIEMFW